MYKAPYSIKFVGEEYKVLKREGNIMAKGKNITWKKGKGIQQYHLPYNIEAGGFNIKCGGRGRTFRGGI